MEVTKAVILAGGLGKRMEPITNIIAKEMLPIVDKPLLSYLIDDLSSCGIKDVLIVSHKSKTEIINYFQNGDINFSYVFPNGANGVVDALEHAKSFVQNKPFVLLFGDVLFYSQKSNIKQMLECYQKAKINVAGAMRVEKSEQKLYGIVECEEKNSFPYIYNIIEKPKSGETKSLIALSGQYVLDNKIFKIIEIQNKDMLFTDVILALAKEKMLTIKIIDGQYFDVGSKAGFIKANIFYSLKHKETQKTIKNYIKKVR